MSAEYRKRADNLSEDGPYGQFHGAQEKHLPYTPQGGSSQVTSQFVNSDHKIWPNAETKFTKKQNR
jgi:hypothetical protein